LLTSILGQGYLAHIVNHMAFSGDGTDACLKENCLPLPVHFYSPVPDIWDLEHRHIWNRRSNLAGIDFNIDGQIELLKKLGSEFGHECDWPANPTEDLLQFYAENGSFSYGCAAGTHSIIRHFRPQRVFEIGSGKSSLIISAALSINAKSSLRAEYTIIDPYPGELVEKGLPGLTNLIKKRVETLDPGFFDSLEENDILFIDSGHTVRIGGDVNYLILDVLPRLAKGVIVHLHDIPLPFEYPKVYATNPRFRVFWTEAYLLQAFLCFNNQFEVLMAMSNLMTEHADQFRAAFPTYDPAKYPSVSGSFWIRRK
jgi:hypothetical protein